VRVDYVRDSSWSAFTRYEGRFVSRILVNAALPVTVDRALDLACHEAYPGHHTISVLLDARFGERRPELLVQPLFSPQSSLHEAAASLAPALAFSEAARIAFERDELFPLAGLDAADAARHATVGRLVDRLHPVVADVARQYLDGVLDFPRAAAALERDALMPNADATLKFVNQFRSYAATYTVGRDRLSRVVAGNWASYLRAVTDPAQTLPRP
jgi:nucleotide-binding universal stress UspA family protein